MSAIEAKFAREAKPDPKYWVITHAGRGSFRLVFIGGAQCSA